MRLTTLLGRAVTFGITGFSPRIFLDHQFVQCRLIVVLLELLRIELASPLPALAPDQSCGASLHPIDDLTTPRLLNCGNR